MEAIFTKLGQIQTQIFPVNIQKKFTSAVLSKGSPLPAALHRHTEALFYWKRPLWPPFAGARLRPLSGEHLCGGRSARAARKYFPTVQSSLYPQPRPLSGRLPLWRAPAVCPGNQGALPA